jgi:putative transposase
LKHCDLHGITEDEARARLKAFLEPARKPIGQHRSTQRKIAKTPDDEAALTADIIALAIQYGRYGYRRTTALLRNADWVVNFKRVERIWRREVLKVPAEQPKRKRLWLKSEFMHQRFPAIVRCPQLV